MTEIPPKEAVIHPEHYNQSKYEVWDVLDVWFTNPLLWQAGKYLVRAGFKTSDPTEDLKKCINYINRFIEQRRTANAPSKP